MQRWFLFLIIWYSRFFSDLYDSFALFSDDNLLLLIITSRTFHNLEFFWYLSCKYLLNSSDSSIIIAVYFMFLCRTLINLILLEKASLDNYENMSEIKYVFSDLWKIHKQKFWIYCDACTSHRFSLSIEMIFRNVCLNISIIAEWSVYTMISCFKTSIRCLIFFSAQTRQTISSFVNQ